MSRPTEEHHLPGKRQRGEEVCPAREGRYPGNDHRSPDGDTRAGQRSVVFLSLCNALRRGYSNAAVVPSVRHA